MAAILGAILLSFLTLRANAADCTTATVGSPYSNCWDISVAAQINLDQLLQFNPGLDCGALQIGQKLCVTAGDLPTTTPQPNPDGSCQTYKTVAGDYCALIGTQFGITAAQIEQFNVNTYKWRGCANLQLDYTLCVSPGTPPPIPVNPNLQCGPESPGAAECPLKACCSAFGFCGVTDEFCKPAPNGEPCQLTRKVGYYAGWAATRGCNPVGVPQLVLTGFTHVIYSFAEIRQDMTIGFENPSDYPRLQELVTKAASTSTQVLVAVGGWTFSQGATKDRFSTMIESAANRAAFTASCNQFINQYNVAGIDIDFEYPASVERQGPPSDTPNLTTFFREFRAGLGSSRTITIATPAGYWFLKGFEMDKIAPNLDFINMMSYDYHGPWDATIPSEDGTAKPQSSVLDMIDSTLLYVKAGVNMNQVNLGLAWYGRTYKLLDSTCTGYGCDMTGGGNVGRCTGESGILANFEIDNIMLDADIRPVLDRSSQTRWFNYNGDLITFDDEGTWAAKTQFAKDRCFGGTMVWSIDQEIPKSNALPGTNLPVVLASTSLNTKWEVPKAGTCKSYGERVWSSRLWDIPSGMDWVQACRQSPLIWDNRNFGLPDECDDQGFLGGVIGRWYYSSNDEYCRPHWGSNANDGCVAHGVRKWYSRLWDVSSGVDWMTMCRSTPNVVNGMTYLGPTYCDDKAVLGAWGVWEVDDESCSGSWGNLKDNGCADTVGKREWSSKLFDIVGSWEFACENRETVIEDEYFPKATRCEKHITGIWGIFETQDITCGVPPCPNDKTWDYSVGACMDCGGSSRLMSVTREVSPERNSTLPSAVGHSSFSRVKTHQRSMSNFTLVPRSSLEKRVKYCDAFWLPRPTPRYFPQFPDTWTDPARAEGPSAADIAASSTAQQAFQEAWNDSFPTPTTAREVGGWIYADPENPNRTRISIDLNNPAGATGRPPPAGWVLVANFHTHPPSEHWGENSDNPSTADQLNAWARGVPGIIISNNGLRAYGPSRRSQMNAPPGYPMGNEEYNGQNSAGTRVGGNWTPQRAPNQQRP
ncbi:hypothetical protein NLJ89_g1634 [Agrocybe chaxingu]|uniref:Chitinase n=1 Tax=Agrocybe chaxingu TaxID=84603 RepID=A0A9W8TD16_9AGAR|nr:hypothetical protein NLJ89_g1634 [Agrocybe chaxingu]